MSVRVKFLGFRMEKGLTYKEFGERCGINSMTISNIENGIIVTPTNSTIYKLFSTFPELAEICKDEFQQCSEIVESFINRKSHPGE